jgi:hypothetical protein
MEYYSQDLLHEFRGLSFEALKSIKLEDLDDFFYNLGMLPQTAQKVAKSIKTYRNEGIDIQ